MDAVDEAATEQNEALETVNQALRTLIQEELAKYLPLTGGTMTGDIILQGAERIGKIFINPTTSEFSLVASADTETLSGIFLGGDHNRLILRAYSSDHVATDCYIDGENGYAVCANSRVVTEAAGSAYAATRTPNVMGVAFSTRTYTFPAGGTWSGFFAESSAAAAWANIAGGTTVDLGKAATWRGLISRTA